MPTKKAALWRLSITSFTSSSPRVQVPVFKSPCSSPRVPVSGLAARTLARFYGTRIIHTLFKDQRISLAARIDAYPGDVITLVPPTAARINPALGVATPRFWRVEVTGIFNTGMFQYDNQFVVMSLPTAQRFAGLGEHAFVSARQENLETIHKHNVVAERHGLLGELTREIRDGDRASRHVTMREWLESS